MPTHTSPSCIITLMLTFIQHAPLMSQITSWEQMSWPSDVLDHRLTRMLSLPTNFLTVNRHYFVSVNPVHSHFCCTLRLWEVKRLCLVRYKSWRVSPQCIISRMHWAWGVTLATASGEAISTFRSHKKQTLIGICSNDLWSSNAPSDAPTWVPTGVSLLTWSHLGSEEEGCPPGQWLMVPQYVPAAAADKN